MPDPILPGKAGLYLSMMHYGLKHNKDFAKENYTFFQTLTEYLGSVKNKRILEIGCGKSFWLTLLLANQGANMTGLDTEVVQPGFSLKKYKALLETNGLERCIRTLIWEQLFARPYYQELEKLHKAPLKFDCFDLKPGNSAKLDFPDQHFDLIVSHEVFEHIADIPATVKELHRILKVNGKTYIYIHNYTSLSGGHHIAWKYPDSEPSARVPAWDHIRDRKFPDIPSWLNQLRMHEYRQAFEQHFEIIDWILTETEGERLLTQEISQELNQYSREELLTKGFIVVAKPLKQRPNSK